jgi:hypothetical protein
MSKKAEVVEKPAKISRDQREMFPGGALIYIGSFSVESGTLHISDPCYAKMKDGIDVEVAKGKWHAFIRHKKYDSWFTRGDERVGELLAFHEYGSSRNDDRNYNEPNWKKIGSVGVDSGQMSIFDKKFYRDDKEADGMNEELERMHYDPEEDKEPGEKFYHACGGLTLPPTLWDLALSLGGTLPHGAVSQSGEGDGGYNVYAAPKIIQGWTRKDKPTESEDIHAVRVVFLGKDANDEEDEE